MLWLVGLRVLFIEIKQNLIYYRKLHTKNLTEITTYFNAKLNKSDSQTNEGLHILYSALFESLNENSTN